MNKFKQFFTKKEKKIESGVALLKMTWLDYKKHAFKFIELLVYALVSTLPLFLVVFIFAKTLIQNGGTLPGSGILGIFTVLFLASLALMFVWNFKAQIGSIILLKEDYQASPRESFKKANKYFIPFVGVSALVMVLVFAWGLLFLVPALIFSFYYGFAKYVQVAEDKRPFRAIERSYDLVKGYWWPVFGRFFLLILISLLLSLVLSLPLTWLNQGSWLFESYNLLISLFWILISPFFVIYPYKIYRSLVKIKD